MIRQIAKINKILDAFKDVLKVEDCIGQSIEMFMSSKQRWKEVKKILM